MTVQEEVNARKTTLQKQQALKLAAGADQLYVAKGKKVTHVDLRKDRPDEESLAKLLLGPTGNLRAPTVRVGNTLIVGFNQETYAKVFG